MTTAGTSAAARNSETKLLALTVLALAIVATVPLLPLLFHGAYPDTHDHLRYAALTEHFRTALQSGIWYPRWLPDLAGGYGYPTFVFYQPLFFFSASIVSLITGLSAPVACWAAIGLASFLCACGCYRLGRMRGSRLFSVLMALLFLVTPYLFVDIYVRGDLSETFAMLLTPWPIYFALKMQERLRSGQPATAAAIALAVSLAAILLAHPATAIAFFGAIVLFAAGLFLDIRDRKIRAAFLKVFIVAVLLSLALSSPFWATVPEMRRYVNFQALTADYFSASGHVVYPKQLLSNFWSFGGSSPRGDDDRMSFQLGAIHFAVALAGLYAARRDLKVRTAFVCYAVLVLLMLPWSRLLWEYVPLLKIMQFPWRLLSVSGIFQFCAALGLARAGRPSRFSAAVIAIALLGFFAFNREQFTINPDTPPANRWGQLEETMTGDFDADMPLASTYTIVNEFLPATAQMPSERRTAPLVEVSEGSAEPLSGSSAYKLNYRLDASVPTTVLIRQFYLPGWRVDLDGMTIPRETIERTLTSTGLMTVSLTSAGRHNLRAWYEGPGAWRARSAIIVLGTLSLTLVLVWLTRRGAAI